MRCLSVPARDLEPAAVRVIDALSEPLPVTCNAEIRDGWAFCDL